MSKIPIHLEEDYVYFSELWEHKSKTNYHSNHKWNERAADWKIELRDNKAVQESNKERVDATMEYLENHQLLKKTDNVIDIGCGPGRFVVEFAKRVQNVVACDISDKMLELAKEYAEQEKVENVQFSVCDFFNVDIAQQQWEKKFDLVFTSITPAIGTLEAIEKINRLSRQYVFNSCSLHRQDSIEQCLAADVFHIETLKKRSHSHWYYALFNLLWLQGYYPETHYYKQHRTETLANGEMLVKYYIRLFKDYDIPNKREIISEFLKAQADSDNNVQREIEHHYGFLLWNVNDRTNRR